MKLEIKNIDLEKVILFLNKLNFRGVQSVNRTKVTNYLLQQLQEVAEGEKTIRAEGKNKPHSWLNQELQNYFEQTVTIEGANYQAGLTAIKDKIEELTSDESEHEFANEDAHALFVLYEAFNLGGDE